MPLLRKLIALAVTTGVAKKAWDAYRGNSPSATDYGRRAGDRSGQASARDTDRRSRPRGGPGYKPDAS